jgi:hypothetical protein
MKLRGIGLISLIMAMLLVSMSVQSAEAVTNHNLYWGIEIGDVFNYRLEIHNSDSSGYQNLDYYVKLDSILTIPENITSIADIFLIGGTLLGATHFSFYFMNDTEITPMMDVPYLEWRAFPIGNLSFVEELMVSLFDPSLWESRGTLIDTETEWGVSITADTSTNTLTIKHSKEDGTLSYYEKTHQFYDGTVSTIKYIRVGEGTPNQVVFVVGAVSIGLLVIALVILRKRS